VAEAIGLIDEAVRRGWSGFTDRLTVEGGWYAVLRIPALQSDDRTVLALLDRGVWVHPGYFFGTPESGWLVLSLLGPAAEFTTGVGAIVNYLRTNPGSNITGIPL